MCAAATGMTEWRKIAGFEGRYDVSDEGEVRSWVRNPRGRLLKSSKDSHGYPKVSLYDDAENQHCKPVHRMVAEAFHGPCPAGHEARHLDGNPANNRSENLAWGSRSENQLDRRAHGTSNAGLRNGNGKLTWDEVLQIRALKGQITQRSLGEWFGCHVRQIGLIQSKKQRRTA